MNTFDDRYQAPRSDEMAAETVRLSKDEWWYAAKVFGVATLAKSILAGAVLTWQTSYALRAFSAEGRVAGIVAVSTIREVGVLAAFSAAAIALVLVVRRRVKADFAPPTQGLFWPILVLMPIATPMIGMVMTGVSLGLLLTVYDGRWDIAWHSILHTFVPGDALIGMIKAFIAALIHGAFVKNSARFLARWHDWPIFACIVASFVTGTTLQVVGRIVLPVAIYFETGEWL